MILLHNKVLVKPIKEEKQGSILLLSSDQKKQHKGKVVLVGEKCTALHEGQVVMYYEHSGTPFPYRGEDDLIILNVGDEKGKGEIISVL